MEAWLARTGIALRERRRLGLPEDPPPLFAKVMLWEVGGVGVASVTAAAARVDRARLAAVLGVPARRLQRASAALILAQFGFAAASVPPGPFRNPDVRIVLDAAAFTRAGAGAGDGNCDGSGNCDGRAMAMATAMAMARRGCCSSGGARAGPRSRRAWRR